MLLVEYALSRLWLLFEGCGNFLSLDRCNYFYIPACYELARGRFPKWLFTLEGAYQFADSGVELVLKERVMLDYAEGDYLGAAKPPSADNYYRTDVSVLKQFDTMLMGGEHTLALHVNNIFDRDNVIPSLYNAEGGLSERGISFDLAWSVAW